MNEGYHLARLGAITLERRLRLMKVLKVIRTPWRNRPRVSVKEGYDHLEIFGEITLERRLLKVTLTFFEKSPSSVGGGRLMKDMKDMKDMKTLTSFEKSASSVGGGQVNERE